MARSRGLQAYAKRRHILYLPPCLRALARSPRLGEHGSVPSRMSNVQECIDLYLEDEEVTDAQFRAVIVDARARDLIEGNGADPLIPIRAQLAEHSRALVLLNRIDSLRSEQLAALSK